MAAAAPSTNFFAAKPTAASPGHTLAKLKRKWTTTEGKRAAKHASRGGDSGGVGRRARLRRSVDLRGPSSRKSTGAKKPSTAAAAA